MRLAAHQVEQRVIKQVVAFLRDHGALLDALRSKPKSPDLVSALLARASRLADVCESGLPASQSEIVPSLVRRITVGENQITIEIEEEALADRLLDKEDYSTSEAKNRRPIIIEVPVRFHRRGVEAKLVVLGRHQPAPEPDANLVKALTSAHEWFGRIASGEAKGLGDIASAERLCRTYITRVLSLAFLSPEITRGILKGLQPPELTAKRLIRSALHTPLLWADQNGVLGFGSKTLPIK